MQPEKQGQPKLISKRQLKLVLLKDGINDRPIGHQGGEKNVRRALELWPEENVEIVDCYLVAIGLHVNK